MSSRVYPELQLNLLVEEPKPKNLFNICPNRLCIRLNHCQFPNHIVTVKILDRYTSTLHSLLVHFYLCVKSCVSFVHAEQSQVEFLSNVVKLYVEHLSHIFF